MDFPNETLVDDILSERSTWVVVCESVLNAIMIVLALAGNLLVCVAVWRNCALRTVSNYFIVSLAVSDIWTPTLCQSISLVVSVARKMILPEWVCQAQASMLISCAMLSVSTMTQTAIHRYIKVVRPRHSPSKKTALVIILGTWIFMFLFPSPYFLFFKAKFYPKEMYCFVQLKFVPKFIMLTGTIGLCLNVVVITLCYSRVFAKVREHKQMIKTTIHKNLRLKNQNRSLSQEEMKITKVLVAVVVGFLICWTPSYCTWTLNLYQVLVPRFMHVIASFCAALSCCLNPLIYGVLNREFKTEFKKMLCSNRQNNEVVPINPSSSKTRTLIELIPMDLTKTSKNPANVSNN